MSAEVIPFQRPLTERVEMAWATHRAFVRAEAHDPTLLDDDAHVKAKAKAKAELDRLYSDWLKQ